MAYDPEFDYADALNDDLAALGVSAPKDAALWLVLIDELYDVPAVAQELTVARGSRDEQPRFDTVPVADFLRRGYNISRIKLYHPDLRPYPQRLLYALDHQRQRPHITLLGLLPRKTVYDASDPTVARILHDYDRLAIPRISRG